MNKIIYDYLSFTTKIHSISNVVDILGLHDVNFQNLRGFYGYKDRMYYDGIHIHYNGSEEMGICVEMSGQGCRNFETLGTGDYDSVFALILEHYSDKSNEREMNIKRLDVAYDDFDGVLDLPLLIQETQKHNFVARFNDWQCIVGNKGNSVNHGSNKSDVYIRIYDKKMERNRDDLEHWVRCEMQLRSVCALGFIKLNGDIRKNYFDVLNNYLRYILPSDNVTNKSMLVTAPYWLNFMESFDTKSIFAKPGVEYNISNLDNLVFNQMGGAVSTMIDVMGVDDFVNELKQRQKGKPLNPKYRDIKRQSEKSDGIADYFNEKKKHSDEMKKHYCDVNKTTGDPNIDKLFKGLGLL